MARATSPRQLTRILERVWPGHAVEKQGQEHMVSCPFCASEKPKCAVNPEKAVFQCWVCGERGNTHKLLDHLVSLSLIRQSDMDAVLVGKKGAGSLSDEIVEYKATGEKKLTIYWSEVSKAVFPTGVRPLYSGEPEDFWDEKLRILIKEYLHKRTVDENDIRRYKLHYCFNPGSVYHGHVFFPALGKFGRELIFWTTRAVLKSDGPKSFHSGHKYSRFSAKQVLFNEHLVVSTTVALCEGPFDAHSIMKVTKIPACPLLGKQLHDYHINRLVEKGVQTVYVCLDPDARSAAQKVAERLMYENMNVFDVSLQNGDPNDISPDELKAAFRCAEKAAGNPVGALGFTSRTSSAS